MNISKNILGLILLSFILVGCNKKSNLGAGRSERTGWEYNKPNKGFFNVESTYTGLVPPGCIYVETGSYVKGQNEDPISTQQDARKRRIEVAGFFYGRI